MKKGRKKYVDETNNEAAEIWAKPHHQKEAGDLEEGSQDQARRPS